MRTEAGNSETNVNAKPFLAFPVCCLRVLHKHFIWGKCSCNFLFFFAWSMLEHHFLDIMFTSQSFSGSITDVFFRAGWACLIHFPLFVHVFQVVQGFKRHPFSHDFASQLPGSYHCHVEFSLKHLYRMCMKSSAATVEIWRSSPMYCQGSLHFLHLQGGPRAKAL